MPPFVAQRLDHRGDNKPLDVGARGEVRAKTLAFVRVQRLFEQRAEDRGVNVALVVRGGLPKFADLLAPKRQHRPAQEELAVELGDFLADGVRVTAAVHRLPQLAHVMLKSFGVELASLQRHAERLLGQQAHVLGGVRQDPTPLRPVPSMLRPSPVPYRQNDAATGKIKWSGALRLAEIIEVADNVKTFRLVEREGGKIPFEFLPGQFLTFAIEPFGIPTKRSYTIASSPTRRDSIEITVKRETNGLVSRWLHDAATPGDLLEVVAPNGTFTFTGEEERSIVLIGGGVGLTPLMSVTRYLTDTNWPGDIHLLLSFRSPREYPFQEEIAALQTRNSRLRVAATMSDPNVEGWTGARGRIDKAFLASAVPNIAAQRVHLCGPLAMMSAVTAALLDLGVPAERIKKEAFGTETRDPTRKAASAGRIVGRVTFQMSQVSAPIAENDTILDVADTAHVFIDNACRSGTCGACRIKLLSGKVRMPVEDSLTQGEKDRGYILACQALAESDVVVES